MVRVWKTKSLLFCWRYDPLIVFWRKNHITFIFIKTMSHDLLAQMAYSSQNSLIHFILVILASSGIKRHPIPFRWFLEVACGKIWGSFGVGDHFGSCLGRFWGSFGVGDHFGSRTNLTICDLFRSICVCTHLSGFFFSAKERCRKLLIELLSSTILNIAWLIDW